MKLQQTLFEYGIPSDQATSSSSIGIKPEHGVEIF